MNALATERDLLSTTLDAAIRDAQTVTTAGERTATQLAGSVRHRAPTHIDDRGMLVEMFDPRWEGITEPLVYAYTMSIRPGRAKGWAIHKAHEDRYFLLLGEAEVVLYDVRPDSPTCGQVERVHMSEYDRGLVTIPRHVWHATRNLGSNDMLMVNFPTVPYNHADPDKYRLPLDTPLIPFSFEGTPGW